MKRPLKFSLLLLCAACAPIPYYGNEIFHRPAGHSEKPYVITGRMEVEPIFGAQKIGYVDVNGEQVIQGQLSPNGTGSFVGQYEGHTVNTTCKPVLNGIDCDVFVDSEKAGTF